MIKVEQGTIFIHRGNRGAITYSINLINNSKYEFQVGDTVQFTVFEKKGYDKIPVIDKSVEIVEVGTSVEILLTENDTIIGEKANKPVTYYYEISLNGYNTTTGYDYDEGAPKFILLPAKGEEINE